MNVRTLCLAILHDGETTGYQIRKLSTEGEFAYFVDASYGSIYPALARLEEDKMVTSRVEQQEGRPAKKVYSITSLGRKTFRESLFTDLDTDEFRSEFLLFARFAPQLPASLVEKRLGQQLANFDAELEQMFKAKKQKLEDSDQWVIDYGINCLSAARKYVASQSAILIGLAQAEPAHPQAAE